MIDGILIDTLNLRARDFALRWKNFVRKAPQLKQYNDIDDDALIELAQPFYRLLSQVLDRGLDRSLVGGFFVKLGKKRLNEGFPVSEVVYAINLAHQSVIEFLMTEYAPENPVRMYSAMGAMTRIAEFFMLGSFYMIKGFFEETYTSMSRRDNISEDLLKKYFSDDFFFKKDEE
jgi:hypothetical protein